MPVHCRGREGKGREEGVTIRSLQISKGKEDTQSQRKVLYIIVYYGARCNINLYVGRDERSTAHHILINPSAPKKVPADIQPNTKAPSGMAWRGEERRGEKRTTGSRPPDSPHPLPAPSCVPPTLSRTSLKVVYIPPTDYFISALP